MSDTIPKGYCQCGCGSWLGFHLYNDASCGKVKGAPKKFLQGHGSRITAKKLSEQHAAHRAWWEANTNVPYGFCWCGCGEKTKLAKSTEKSMRYVKGGPKRFLMGHDKRAVGPEYVEEDRGHDTPCWIWQRGKNRHGYGLFGRFEGSNLAHRVFYERVNDPVPSDLCLDHLCRVSSCVNPEHLEAVTHTENCRRGAKARLSMDEARTIRRLYASGAMRRSELAERFKVSGNQISQILSGRAWKDD